MDDILRTVMCLGSLGSLAFAKLGPKVTSRPFLGSLLFAVLLTCFLGAMWARSPVFLGSGG